MNRPTHPLVIRGREALNRGDLTGASAAAEERLRSDARDTDALELRYLVHQGRGDTARAAETLQSVIAMDPTADWAFNDLINLLYTHRRRPDAEQVARAALRANPSNGQAHYLFGTLLSEQNDLPSGEWHFRRALELAGDQPPILMNLALNLMQQGRTDEADACFAQADAAAPGDTRTLAYWAKLHEARGDLKRAGELLDRAEAASSPSEVNLLRASYLERCGRTAAPKRASPPRSPTSPRWRPSRIS
jgi:Tfp pilus assembly protein PilF